MESLVVIWVMFFDMTSISAHEMIHPYGPVLCRQLEIRYGRETSYYQHNLTCVVSDDKTASVNGSCAEVIHNRKGEAVCIQDIHLTTEIKSDSVAEQRSQQSFIKSDANIVYSINLKSGTQIDKITIPELNRLKSCSHDGDNIYFYSKKRRIVSLYPHSRKVEALTKRYERKRSGGMAVGGTDEILKLEILKNSVLHVLWIYDSQHIVEFRVRRNGGMQFVNRPLWIESSNKYSHSKKHACTPRWIQHNADMYGSDDLFFAIQKYMARVLIVV